MRRSTRTTTLPPASQTPFPSTCCRYTWMSITTIFASATTLCWLPFRWRNGCAKSPKFFRPTQDSNSTSTTGGVPNPSRGALTFVVSDIHCRRKPLLDGCVAGRCRGRVWVRPLFPELSTSFRRSKPRVVAYDLGVIWRVEFVEAGCSNSDLSLTETLVNFDDLIAKVAIGGVAAPTKSRRLRRLSCQKSVTFLSNP